MVNSNAIKQIKYYQSFSDFTMLTFWDVWFFDMESVLCSAVLDIQRPAFPYNTLNDSTTLNSPECAPQVRTPQIRILSCATFLPFFPFHRCSCWFMMHVMFLVYLICSYFLYNETMLSFIKSLVCFCWDDHMTNPSFESFFFFCFFASLQSYNVETSGGEFFLSFRITYAHTIFLKCLEGKINEFIIFKYLLCSPFEKCLSSQLTLRGPEFSG